MILLLMAILPTNFIQRERWLFLRFVSTFVGYRVLPSFFFIFVFCDIDIESVNDSSDIQPWRARHLERKSINYLFKYLCSCTKILKIFFGYVHE